MSSRPKRLTSRERLDIILARFENIRRTGVPTSLAKLQERFGHDPAVISRLIGSGFRSGLIEIKIAQPDSAPPLRRTDLEDEILNRYSRLIAAIVVEGPAPPEQNASNEERLTHSDQIHRILGAALAQEICQGTFIRHEDRVGIGPGRGVYETVRAMQRLPQIRARNVTLVSLSGVGYMRHHSKNRNLLLDPDFIVAFMGEAFEYPVALDLVASPLVRVPNATSPRTWICSTDRARPKLDTSILGVGAFLAGNRFFEEGSQVSKNFQLTYDPIRPALRSLAGLHERLASPDYTPLGDVGYHLFLVPPPREKESLFSKMKTEIQRQIDAINMQLLSAHREDFQAMRSAVLVAGTPVKARAIRHLLGANLVHATHLCIDKATAETLLALG